MKTFEEACAIFRVDCTEEELASGDFARTGAEHLAALNSKNSELLEEINHSQTARALVMAAVIACGGGDIGAQEALLMMFAYGVMVGMEMEKAETGGVCLA